jgi:hypothetical protein
MHRLRIMNIVKWIMKIEGYLTSHWVSVMINVIDFPFVDTLQVQKF